MKFVVKILPLACMYGTYYVYDDKAFLDWVIGHSNNGTTKYLLETQKEDELLCKLGDDELFIYDHNCFFYINNEVAEEVWVRRTTEYKIIK